MGKKSSVIALLVAIILSIVQVVVFKRCGRVSEIAALRCLNERMDQKSPETVEENEFVRSLDGALKLYNGTVKAALFIIFLNLAGGFIGSNLKMGKPLLEAIEEAVRITSGSTVVFLLPMLIVSLAIWKNHF